MAIHTSSALAGEVARYRSGKEMRKSVGQKSDGITFADTVDIDVKKLVLFFFNQSISYYIPLSSYYDRSFFSERFQRFPDGNLPNQLFNNIAFKNLPIIHIKVTKNNTIVNCSDSEGKVMIHSSCGMNGFKNCRKGTNVAGQATAIVVAKVS